LFQEIQLYMSRAYGPGSYDASYEKQGRDYPLPYVRWTENRNMEEFLRLIAGGRIDVRPLITHEFALDEAANVVRWRDLPKLYSHFGSRGIVVMTVLQSWAQGERCWGAGGMKALWGAANVRVREGRICAIYDMDSVALVDEMRGLASTAVHHTYTGAERQQSVTSREQARAFVADYEVARARALTSFERERLNAAAIYAMAYTARCEHSRDPAGLQMEGSMRAALREAPSTGYLD